MTDKEILQKAIEKAKNNKWDSWLFYERFSGIDLSSVYELQRILDYNLYSTIIFSHSFAKAFWGEEERNTLDWYPWAYPTIENWRYHLSQMVMHNNPLEYLEKFL